METYRVKLRAKDVRAKRAWWENVKPEQVRDTIDRTIFEVRRNAATSGCKVLRIRDTNTNTDIYCVD